MTFLLSEDKALRQKLENMVVQDQRADFEGQPRKVGVWFGMPDQEIRDQSYPYLTIDMIDINRDTSREMRGVVPVPEYLLGEAVIPVGRGGQIDLPIPVNIDYQITSYARHPRHDRELLSQLLYTKLPMRAGLLGLDDGTVRRLDVVDIAKRDMVEQGKRLFMNAITVRVSSEIAQGTLKTLYKVNSVTLGDLYTFDLSV
jgi:hypothetical protein